MHCPMRTDSTGYSRECLEQLCAWWNAQQQQCCIKTFINYQTENFGGWTGSGWEGLPHKIGGNPVE